MKHIHGKTLLGQKDVIFPDLDYLIMFLGLGADKHYIETPWIDSITLEYD